MRRSTRCLIGVFWLAAALLTATHEARAEAFVDLYLGAAVTGDAGSSLRGGPQAGPLTPLVDGKRTEFKVSVAPGGRAGYWLESLPWLGFAVDASYFQLNQKVAPGEETRYSIRVTPYSGLLMVRYPLWKTSEFPVGQAFLYGAAGPGLFRSKFSGFTASDSSLDIGTDVRVGVKFFHLVPSWGLFAEYRFTRFEPSSFAGNNPHGVVEAHFNPLNSHFFLFGTSFHF
jgi:Outer membrane protein beta-barrel domain